MKRFPGLPPLFTGGIVWALLIPAQKAPEAQLALWHPTLPIPPVTSSFPGLRLESHPRKRRVHNGHWHYAAVPTEESRSVLKAGAQGWDLSLAASEQTSAHCYSTAYDKSHCSGNNAKMFDFLLSQHCVTAGQMETLWAIKQDKFDRIVNHKIVSNCRAADSIYYNPVGIWCFLHFFLPQDEISLP